MRLIRDLDEYLDREQAIDACLDLLARVRGIVSTYDLPVGLRLRDLTDGLSALAAALPEEPHQP